MTDDNLDDTQQDVPCSRFKDRTYQSCENLTCHMQGFCIYSIRDIGAEIGMPPIQDSVGISKPIPSTEALVIETWNAAIEAAAMKVDNGWWNGDQIRKLKK